MRSTALLLPALLLIAPSASAQTIQKIVEVGDTLPGAGTVVGLKGPAVDDSGRVLVYAWTDDPDPVTRQTLVDETGAVAYRGGQALAQPSGATIASFKGGEQDASPGGPMGFLLGLAGTAGTHDDDGYYYGPNLDLALQKSAISTAPQLTPGSAYALLLPPKINDSSQFAFHASIDDPNVTGTYDTEALVVLDPIAGTQRVVYQLDELLPGQTYEISDFNWDGNNLAFNNAGQVLFGATIYSASATNGVVYLDDVKIAQKGDPSPWGINYTQVSTSLTASDLNSAGEYALLAQLGGGYGIVDNGAPFVRSGDALPDIAPHKLAGFGQVIRLGDDGRLLWSGYWELPDGSQGRGLFVDYSLLVEQGVTRIGGLLVQGLDLTDHELSMSRSGQFVVFVATLEGGARGTYLIDLWQ